MHYQQTTIQTKVPWRATVRAIDSRRPGRLSKSNVSPAGSGATNYGKVKAGTILAKDTNDLLHPLGLADITADVTAANDVVVDNVAGLFVGDTVAVCAGDDRPAVIPNNSVDLTITPRVVGLSLVIAVAGTSTAFSSSYNPVNKTITINSATNGGGSATSTHADIVSELVSKFGSLVKSASSATPATTVAALSSTSLGTPKYGPIATARTISTISTLTLTLSGAAITCKDGDYVVKSGAYKAVGILDETVDTVDYIDGNLVARDRSVTVAYEGDARKNSALVCNLPGGTAGDIARRMLSGAPFIDPVDGVTELLPEDLVGFRWLTV